MKRCTARLLTLLLVVLLAPAAPAWADRTLVLKASGAETGNNQTADFDVQGFATIAAFVNVTAGSGTVGTFKVLLEGTNDGGTVYYDIPCDVVTKNAADTVTPVVTGTSLIVNETAVVTAAKYVCVTRVGTARARARWVIAGTTPSETFSVTVNLK